MGSLTTHVLDTALGKPASGVRIELFSLSGSRKKIADVVTNDDGRVDNPLLSANTFARGEYELVFHAGDYLRQTSNALSSPAFLDVIPIRFGISEATHYHVPLLLSAFGYSTYRGS